MATHQKSIMKEALDRFESRMAIGESRREAKRVIRAEQGPTWSVSTGKLHSFKTRGIYQEHTLKFITWARAKYGVKRLVDLDARAEELASEFLQARLAESKSAYTLKVERAALRFFFMNSELAAGVKLPPRTRSSITRSRHPVLHDRYFQPKNWQPMLKFLEGTGLRRNEVRTLTCRDVYTGMDGKLYVHVDNGKGGRPREVPVLPGREDDVRAVVAEREPEERVFARIPGHLDVHSYRRLFAQALYLYYAPGRVLPSAEGRLKRSDYDRDAAQKVSEALGHNRIDVVLRHYIR